MTWLWLNIPLGCLFFLAISGIPLWMVIRHPDVRPARADATGTSVAWRVGSVLAPATERPSRPAEGWARRELAGASAGDRG